MAMSKILLPISSDSGELASSFFAGYVLDVDENLKAEINQAWEILAKNSSFHSIQIEVRGNALPGSDYFGDQPSERDRERLADTLDALVEPRAVRKRESALLKRCAVWGARGHRLVVCRFVAPSLRLHQKYDGEQFTSPWLDMLAPEGLKREWAATRRQVRRAEAKREAAGAAAAAAP